MPGRFADSNALLYFASNDPRKAIIAETILREDLTISVQVLNEMANVLRRKWGWEWEQTHDFVELIREQTEIRSVTLETHELGLWMSQRYRLSVYDGMIVAAALLADCDTLYSEDMHDGLHVEGRLQIVDPFRAAAA